MRLTEKEQSAIASAITPFARKGMELWLFGSRTDDSARGGDIDLLLILPNESGQKKLARQKIDLLVAIKNTLGEQKIDLLITTRERISQDPFLTIITETALLIQRW